MRSLLLDGAMGTELERRGVRLTSPLWSALALTESPELITDIHREYIMAGADIITTNTFRTNRRAVLSAGLSVDDSKRLTIRAAELAREARYQSGQNDVIVAGSIAPVADCYSPGLVPSDEELIAEHTEHMRWLIEGGCDMILIETMNTLREAVTASMAAQMLSLKFMVSMVTDATGERLLSGELLSDAVIRLTQYCPQAILTNCASPDATLRATTILSQTHNATDAGWMFGGYPNGGVPDPGYENIHLVSAKEFTECIEQMHGSGARVLGSCCQTTPALTSILHDTILSLEQSS